MHFRADVAASKSGKQIRRKVEKGREEGESSFTKASDEYRWRRFMNERMEPCSCNSPIRLSNVTRSKRSARYAWKSTLRQYNFGSDTRMAWNATIGVNERYRRLRYVVNGPSLASSRAPIHLSISYTLHVPIYTHNIELPTFSFYQSKD